MGAKSEPPWVFLEREMKQKNEIKPYNEKVGDWLKFMKDLKHYQYREGKTTLITKVYDFIYVSQYLPVIASVLFNLKNRRWPDFI